MTIKNEIQNILTISNFENPNSWVRRFFRLFLEGSYGFENRPNFNNLKNRVNPKMTDKQFNKQLRSFTIEQFSKFGALEFNCSRGYFQKVMVETFSKDELKMINLILGFEIIDEMVEGGYLEGGKI
tara:strand:+ start:184 stop:561 length:378 start_codon:yes stop_codon:yes gene_type:complete